jgi:hypothetical protein
MSGDDILTLEIEFGRRKYRNAAPNFLNILSFNLVCDHCLCSGINYTAMTETNYIKQIT